MKNPTIFFLMLMLSTACSEKDPYVPEESRDEFSFSVTTTDAFEAGDRIGIYAVPAGGTIGDIAYPMNVPFDFDGSRWVAGNGVGILSGEAGIDIYAYAPYDPGMSAAEGKLDLSAYPYDLSGDQGARKTDFVWSKSSTGANAAQAAIVFTHLLVRIAVNIQYGVAELTNPVLELHNFNTGCLIDMRTGTVTTQHTGGVITAVRLPDAVAGYDTSFEAVVPPQALAAGTPVFLFRYNDDQTSLVTLSEDVTVNGTLEYTFNLTIPAGTARVKAGIPTQTMK